MRPRSSAPRGAARPQLPRRGAVTALAAFLLLLAAPTTAFAQARAEAPRHPNILLVLTDDQGWGDVRSHGNPAIDTPVMDRLARESARFERFYVSPVCAPTRASLMTGRYSLRTGTQWVTFGLETMRPDEVTMAEVLRDAGYATGLFGKWHNGSHYPSDPVGQGFDTFVGFAAGHWNNYFDATLESDHVAGRLGAGGHVDRQALETTGDITDVLTDSTLAFIDRNRDRPFFAYVPYNAPHGPFQVTDRYFDKYTARGLDDKTAAVYGMVDNADENLGRILAEVDRLGLRDDTIVLFLTDNGPNGERFNGHMHGIKASVHEGGSRVPLFVRWPGHMDSTTVVRHIAAHIDLLPTLAEMAGVPLPAGLALDGISLAPTLLRTGPEPTGQTLFTHHSETAALRPYPGAVRTDRWRAVRYGDAWELYDMTADPSEAVDVAPGYPDLVARFAAEYDAWFADASRGLSEPRRAPVGYAEAPGVDLPAVESTFTGSIRYAGESGWSNDWLTGWAQGGTASWLLDVVAPGTYRVSADVTAPRAGVRLEASVGRARTAGDVPTFDPPLTPSPDRVPRGEVYAKPWETVDLGTIRLDAGPATVTVRALTDRQAADALDLHTFTLTRLDAPTP